MQKKLTRTNEELRKAASNEGMERLRAEFNQEIHRKDEQYAATVAKTNEVHAQYADETDSEFLKGGIGTKGWASI